MVVATLGMGRASGVLYGLEAGIFAGVGVGREIEDAKSKKS